MIQKFVAAFEENKEKLRAGLEEKHPEDYADLVKRVVSVFALGHDYGHPDPDKIHLIDDGDYQGTLLFIVPEKRYQPNTYWFVKVGYGSCSGCDTFQDIQGYSGDKPTKKQVDDYLTLMLHIVQGFKEMGEEC